MSKKNKKVRVAIIGVGNCASSLVQGVQYYRDAPDDAEIPGLMHATVGGYHVRDIEFTAGDFSAAWRARAAIRAANPTTGSHRRSAG